MVLLEVWMRKFMRKFLAYRKWFTHWQSSPYNYILLSLNYGFPPFAHHSHYCTCFPPRIVIHHYFISLPTNVKHICLFTKYHIQRHLLYIYSLLQLFAINCRTEILYEVEKECILGKHVEKEEGISLITIKICTDWCKRNVCIKSTSLVVLMHSVHLN